MKKILSLLTVLLFVLAAFPVTGLAQGIDGWEEAQVVPASGFTGDLIENADLVHWMGNWTGRSIGYVLMAGRYTCASVPGCYAADYYIDVTIHVTISDLPGGGPYTLVVDGQTEENIVTVDCSSTGECAAHAFFYYPADEVTTEGPWAGYFSVTATLTGGLDPTYSWDVDVLMTRDSAQLDNTNCDENFQVVNSIIPQTVIPVSSEAGSSTTLEIGNTYRVTVLGWWDDGETHIRRDTDIRQGEAGAWVNTDELVTNESILCKQVNITDPSQIQFVFTATETDFSIRVNDEEGSFDDNTTAMISGTPISFALELVREVQPYGCEAQFLSGELLKTMSFAASNSNGVTVIPSIIGLVPGDWFTVVVEGTWQNNGSGAERSDVAMRSFTYNTWTELTGSTWTNCTDAESQTYYLQLVDSEASYLSFRANDTDGVWASNTGTITISIYAATYDPLPAACEEQYLIGQLVNTGNISAQASAGLAIMAGKNDPPWPAGGESLKRYLMVETFGDPFSDGTTYSGSPDLNDDGIWYFPTNMPSATCVVKTDQIGHYRIYFEYSIELDYGIRVHDNDSNYANNSGTMGWNVYHATYYDPDLTDCSAYYNHLPDPLITYTLAGNASAGSVLPLLENDAVYAVVTSGGPWLDDGTTSYEVAMTGGGSYYSLIDFPGALCSSVDGDYVTMYFKATQGRDYRLRVADGDANFENNSSSITVTIYPADSDADPWSSCDENYTLVEVPLSDEERTIPAYAENGVLLSPVKTSGDIYAVEINVSPTWSDPLNDDDLHSAEIKSASTAWENLYQAEFLECVVHLDSATSDRYRVYFTAEDAPYYLRVHNLDATFLDNTGEIKYTLYRVTDVVDDDSVDPYDQFNFYVPPEWSSVCYESCMRPTALFSVQTIDYATCTIVKFYTWCPHHTEYMMSIPDKFNRYEPFGTFIEMEDAMLAVRSQLEGFTSIGGEEADTYTPHSIIWNEGGGEGNGSTFTGFVPSSNGSVFADGFEWDPSATVNVEETIGGETEATGYVAYCLPVFSPLFGSNTSNTFCRMVNVLRGTIFMNMVWIPLQFLVDLAAIVGLIAYAKKNWINTGAAS